MLVLLTLAGCSHEPPTPTPASVTAELVAIAGPPTSCTGEPSAWVERPVGRDRVRYSAGLEADAERADAGVSAVRSALADLIGVPSSDTPAALLWLVTASPQVRSGVALTMSSSTSATVFLYSPGCDTDPRPRRFERTIAHELSGEYLQAATRASPAGWTFYSGPGWFIQGAEEWVARQVHEQPLDLIALATDRASKPPVGAITLDGVNVKVHSDYRDGEALVAWLVLTQGSAVLNRLLVSDASTFGGALVEVAGLDVPGLVAGYTGWRAESRL